jgi:hypothetical protein
MLSVPQWEHLVFGVTAWLLCGVAKLCRLASVVDGGHRTSLARFLSGAEWGRPKVIVSRRRIEADPFTLPHLEHDRGLRDNRRCPVDGFHLPSDLRDSAR